VPKVIEAPLGKGDAVGQMQLRLHDEVLYEAPLVSLQDVPEAGIVGRISDFVSLFIDQLLSDD
jgi:D-alanyl-D-alanine carboxypeptidase (penicillin-binding protein 5/6)